MPRAALLEARGAARHRASACSRPCCRASTSPTRRRRPRAQVNNIHLLRGMIGRPGAGVLQMNGQPTAQNTRETGADGDLPGSATGRTPAHVAGARRRSGTSTSTGSRTGRRRPTRCRSSATRSRARSGCCGSAHQPGGVAARPRPHPPDPRARGAVRRRPGHLPDRDRRARRRRAPGGDLGREDRHVHERRPDRAPLRAGPSIRPARRAPTSTSSSTSRGGWTSATATGRR